MKKAYSIKNNDEPQLRQFLGQLHNTPLLTAAEEIMHGKAIKKLQLLERTYLEIEEEQEPSIEALSNRLEQTFSTLRQWLVEGSNSREIMLKANLKLVVKIVNRYNAKNVDKFDLIQAAIEKGLKKAIEKFDPELGYKFSTYSVWWF